MRVPWTVRRSNQSILKEISSEYSLEGLMLMLKLQCCLPDMKNYLLGKDHDAWKDWCQHVKGMTENEMVGWHHWLGGQEFEQTLGVGDGQGSLVATVYGDFWNLCKSTLGLQEQLSLWYGPWASQQVFNKSILGI